MTCLQDRNRLAEIENKGVLYKLLKSTALRKYDYDIIHYDSGDRRGIDVAFLYRKSVMHPESVLTGKGMKETGPAW